MTDSAGLRRKISGAGELRGVVRTMKALAASNIAQYEKSVLGLADYVRTVELGLGAALRQNRSTGVTPGIRSAGCVDAVIFGSDQGLVGPFNDSIAEHAISTLAGLGERVRVWAVGARVQVPLQNAGVKLAGSFRVPASLKGITALVGRILLQTQSAREQRAEAELHLFHNRPGIGASYSPVWRRLLPLDENWRDERMALLWPSHRVPEIVGVGTQTLRALIGEYLFVSLFRAGAESLASEQASRLASMQRAERNIDDLLGVLGAAFHRLRQGSIDEELFDVVSGFEALKSLTRAPTRGAA